jgi:Amt family ammonium transporter
MKHLFFGTLLMGLVVGLTALPTFAQDPEPEAPAAEAAPPTPEEGEAETPETAEAPVEERESEAALEAEDAPPSNADLLDYANVLWTCLAAFLVFFMQAGFAMVEAGFTRAKNACNIIMKNLMDLSVGSMLFWLIGFGLMFGTSPSGWIGTDNFIFDAAKWAPEQGSSVAFGWAFLIFQTVFCATAATIVSGAVAERTKFTGYLVYSIAICAFVYPIFGSWAWGSLWMGEGWLEKLGFYDFAGSTVVHSIGGWAALAGAIVIGPRLGKYGKDGKVNPIPGHSIPMGALGVFILWLGWFGFNAGSTTSVNSNFAEIAVVTNLAAAAGSIGAMIATWVVFKKPDPSLALNGALAGLVAITAGCDTMTPAMASLTGLIGGLIVVAAVVFFDKIKIDDPVGAISVHGVCGAWGTLAVGLLATEKGLLLGFGSEQLIAQLYGIGAAFLWSFPVSLVIFLTIKYTIGLRVAEEEEMRGLDVTEHGISAYPPAMVADHHISGSGATLTPGRSAERTPEPALHGAS